MLCKCGADGWVEKYEKELPQLSQPENLHLPVYIVF